MYYRWKYRGKVYVVIFSPDGYDISCDNHLVKYNYDGQPLRWTRKNKVDVFTKVFDTLIEERPDLLELFTQKAMCVQLADREQTLTRLRKEEALCMADINRLHDELQYVYPVATFQEEDVLATTNDIVDALNVYEHYFGLRPEARDMLSHMHNPDNTAYGTFWITADGMLLGMSGSIAHMHKGLYVLLAEGNVNKENVPVTEAYIRTFNAEYNAMYTQAGSPMFFLKQEWVDERVNGQSYPKRRSGKRRLS